MKWMKEKRKNKSIYNMTKLELIANLKEKQKIIDEAKELVKDNQNATWQVLKDYCSSREKREHNKIHIELLNEDMEFTNYLLDILGDKE